MLPELMRHVRAARARHDTVALRARLVEAAHTEDLWLRVISVASDTLVRGVLIEAPQLTSRYSIGDTVHVGPALVLDWYAQEGGGRAGDFLAAEHGAVHAGAASGTGTPAPTVQPSMRAARADVSGDAPAPGWLTLRCS
jgi:hypothetical protein